MNKTKKTIMSLGMIATTVAPIATVISCNHHSKGYALLDIQTQSVGSYGQALTKLANGDITVTGAWGDARFYAGNKKNSIHVVGVEKNRISNDGIQARTDLNASDQKAIQNLFQDLIQVANAQKAAVPKGATSLPTTDNSLLILADGKVKTIFEIYSHSNYKAVNNNEKITVLDKGKLKVVKAMNGSIKPSSAFNSAKSEYFSVATKLVAKPSSSTDLKAEYETKKTLKIQFIPSGDAKLVGIATEQLSHFLKNAGVTAEITVSTDYNTAASLLEKGILDLAFLPAATWAKYAPSTNFILQAARPVQISTLDFSDGKTAKLSGTEITSEITAIDLFNKYGQLYLEDVASGTNADFEKAAKKVGSNEAKIKKYASSIKNPNDFLSGAYEAWIYTKKGSALDKTIDANNNKENWKIPYSKVKSDLVYGYTSSTSGASYLFPELWFHEHFTD